MGYYFLSISFFVISIILLIWISHYKVKSLNKGKQSFFKIFLTTSWSEVFLSTLITIFLTAASGLFFYELQKRNTEEQNRKKLIAYLEEVLEKKPKIYKQEYLTVGYINGDVIHSLNDQGDLNVSVELIMLEEYIRYFHLFHNEVILYSLTTHKQIDQEQKRVVEQAQDLCYAQVIKILKELRNN